MDTNKISQQINNIVGDNLKALSQLFPSAVKDGMLDVETLKEELGQVEEVESERYELTWSGKQSAKKLAQEDVYNRTLKYVAEGSTNPTTTENLYIEGDNLEVLKLLNQNYYGSIKMIYIDPPYNTGNDFVYNDKFAMDKKESDTAEGISDENGNPLQRNQQSSNRYHANWLNMIYPRLKLAKDLLADDGVIFISIDDNEVKNLRAICDEIFGEHNFISELIWERAYSPKNDAKYISNSHDFVLMYTKNINNFSIGRLERTQEANARYKNPDNDPRGDWKSTDMSAKTYSATYDYEITLPSGRIVTPPHGSCWRLSKESYAVKLKDNRISFGLDGNGVPRIKTFLSELKFDGMAPQSILFYKDVGHSQEGRQELKSLFDDKGYFDGPKPVRLLRRLLTLASTDKDSIILDFFSGSATTAHAVMQLNAEDGGNRKFIMVQYPEVIDEKSEAYKAGYKNICEIGKERIRRAGEKILADNKDKEGIESLDVCFKVFRTADTNIKWNLHEYGLEEQITTATLQQTPDEMDFVQGTKDIDVVYEIMLRQKDVPLSDTLEVLSDIGDRTYLYASSYLVCLETEITEELIERLAALAPLPIKFVFRDSAFKDDIDLKDYSFRHLKALVERNSGETKQTYTVEFI